MHIKCLTLSFVLVRKAVPFSEFHFIHCCLVSILMQSSFSTVALVGLTLCHQQLQNPQLSEVWRKALQTSFVITLCRDEVLLIHTFIMEGLKGLVM
jgi:Membrane-associated apoptosis protein